MVEVEAAVELLRAGGLVAFPTETVYGLGADATNSDAVRHLFTVKGRPPTLPVIAHIANTEALDRWAVEVPAPARALADACWPGPLTLVVARGAGIVNAVTGGRDTVGLRVPDHPLALALLAEFDRPVAAPSANRFGRVSPTTAAHVRADLRSDVDMVLDGGPCAIGVESTIVDCTTDPPVILRVGGTSVETVREVAGEAIGVAGTEAQGRAPGTLAHHYAPLARVEIVSAQTIDARRTQLEATGCVVVDLEPSADHGADAHDLYARLRAADDAGADVVLAVLPHETGLGTAIADRLRRAAGAS